MTDERTHDTDTEHAPSRPQSPRHRILEALRHELEERTDPGTLAALRRMDPSAPPAAFFRVGTKILDEVLPEEGARRLELETRWAIVVKAMAAAVGRKGSFSLLARVPFGEALAKAKVAEMRLLRLLNARGDQVDDVVRGAVHQLVSTGQPFDIRNLADFVLSEGERRESARRHIAQHFYRHQGT